MPVAIDIEAWPLTGDKAVRARNVPRLLTVVDALRKARPDLQFGFYDLAPERVYFPLIDPKKRDERIKWEAGNRMAAADFIPHVDAVFPSLYTFYEDEKGWETYAREMLQAARKFKKPVYAYLWPKFHDSNPCLPASICRGSIGRSSWNSATATPTAW